MEKYDKTTEGIYDELLTRAGEELELDEKKYQEEYEKLINEYRNRNIEIEVHDGNLIEFPNIQRNAETSAPNDDVPTIKFIEEEKLFIEPADLDEKGFDRLKRLIETSVSKEKRGVIEKWSKRVAKVAIIAIIILLLETAIGEYKDYLNNREMINQHGKEIIAVVDEAKYYDRDQERVTNYDSTVIAEYLLNDIDNFDTNFFHVYRKVRNYGAFSDHDIRKIMNSVLTVVSYRSDGKINYQNFADYVTVHGFVDESGNPDYDAYKKYMEEFIILNVQKTNIEGQIADMTQDGEPGIGGR